MVMGDKQKEEEDLAAMRCEEEEDEEDGYFSGYAHFSIHHDMLAVIFRFVFYINRLQKVKIVFVLKIRTNQERTAIETPSLKIAI
jgi:hypothetical protein